jgi:hypothetical protein
MRSGKSNRENQPTHSHHFHFARLTLIKMADNYYVGFALTSFTWESIQLWQKRLCHAVNALCASFESEFGVVACQNLNVSGAKYAAMAGDWLK